MPMLQWLHEKGAPFDAVAVTEYTKRGSNELAVLDWLEGKE